MQTQTVFKAGNSDVVAIPKSLGKDLGITSGRKVTVDREGERIVIERATKTKAKVSSTNKEFKKWLKEVLEEDAEILDELANR